MDRAEQGGVMSGLNRRIDMQTCREHHEALRILLEQFPSGVPLNANTVSKLLARLSSLLLAHLRLEDTQLYPALESSANRTVRETATRYRNEMGGLKEAYVDFSATWGSETAIAANPEGFFEAWSGVRSALEIRMAKEDHGLYSIADDYLKHDESA